jgi:hypothetical protein
MTDFSLGYAIGLIVGEGSFTGDRRSPVLAVKLHEDDPLPLESLRATFGGRVNGPYKHADRERRGFIIWQLRGDDLLRALPTLLEHMPACRKRTQMEAWCDKWASYLPPSARTFTRVM